MVFFLGIKRSWYQNMDGNSASSHNPPVFYPGPSDTSPALHRRKHLLWYLASHYLPVSCKKHPSHRKPTSVRRMVKLSCLLWHHVVCFWGHRSGMYDVTTQTNQFYQFAIEPKASRECMWDGWETNGTDWHRQFLLNTGPYWEIDFLVLIYWKTCFVKKSLFCCYVDRFVICKTFQKIAKFPSVWQTLYSISNHPQKQQSVNTIASYCVFILKGSAYWK